VNCSFEHPGGPWHPSRPGSGNLFSMRTSDWAGAREPQFVNSEGSVFCFHEMSGDDRSERMTITLNCYRER